MISVASKCKKIKDSEIYFDKAISIFGDHIVLYNALIHAYSWVPDW